MSQYWFKAKSCGWGIGKVTTWQGVLALFVLVAAILLAAYADGFIASDQSLYQKNMVRFGLDVLMLSGLFCLVVADKIEGGLHWRWKSK